MASAVAFPEEAPGPTRSAGVGCVCGVGAAERPRLLLSSRTTKVSSLACRKVKVVGKPYEGIPHVRFDVAGSGNQHLGARRHSLTLLVAGGMVGDGTARG